MYDPKPKPQFFRVMPSSATEAEAWVLSMARFVHGTVYELTGAELTVEQKVVAKRLIRSVCSGLGEIGDKTDSSGKGCKRD